MTDRTPHGDDWTPPPNINPDELRDLDEEDLQAVIDAMMPRLIEIFTEQTPVAPPEPAIEGHEPAESEFA